MIGEDLVPVLLAGPLVCPPSAGVFISNANVLTGPDYDNGDDVTGSVHDLVAQKFIDSIMID